MKINFNGTNGKINFNGAGGKIYFGNPTKVLTPTILLMYQVYNTGNSLYGVYARTLNNEINDGVLYFGISTPPATFTAIPGSSYLDTLVASSMITQTITNYSQIKSVPGKTLDSDITSMSYTISAHATSAPSFVSVVLYDPDPMGSFPRSLKWRVTVTNNDAYPVDVYAGYVQTKDGSTPADPTDASVTTLRLSNVAPGTSSMWEQTTGSVTVIEWERLKIKLKIKSVAKNVVDTQAKPASSIVASGTISG